MDIRKYFASIDHAIILSILARKIKDPYVMDLCEKIIRKGGDGKTGLPIGNLTSQFFANVYLDILDHHVKEKLRIKGYLRYMDDFCFFSNDKNFLKSLRYEIEEFLQTNLKLVLKESATLINTRQHGLPFLGVRIWVNLVRLRRENFERSYKTLQIRERELINNYISYERYQSSVNSLVSYLNFWGNNLLKNKLLEGSLSKAAGAGTIRQTTCRLAT
jgi:retron-type reverse transcriptase